MNADQKKALVNEAIQALDEFQATNTRLAGLRDANTTRVFAKQIVDSIRRVMFVERVSRLAIDKATSVPTAPHFDPIRAAVYHKNYGNFDEACWLVFLSVHCGKHLQKKWLLARELYGLIDPGAPRNWEFVTSSPGAFSEWLRGNTHPFKGMFGNHRKYESLDCAKRFNTGEVIDSYAAWVSAYDGHQQLLDDALLQNDGSAKETFAYLYNAMDKVCRFGRTGRFDFLTMLAKLGLVNIEPDKAYLASATGPRRGVRQLLTDDPAYPLRSSEGEALVAALGSSLPIPSMTMQVMEDALCNWQKNPQKYICFRG